MYNHLIAVQGQSQEAFEVLLNFLAKAFLEQVKQEVHATPFAAYFLARFAYLLVSTIPAFLDYLMGRLFKRCPYLIPQYHDDNHVRPQDEYEDSVYPFFFCRISLTKKSNLDFITITPTKIPRHFKHFCNMPKNKSVMLCFTVPCVKPNLILDSPRILTRSSTHGSGWHVSPTCHLVKSHLFL